MSTVVGSLLPKTTSPDLHRNLKIYLNITELLTPATEPWYWPPLSVLLEVTHLEFHQVLENHLSVENTQSMTSTIQPDEIDRWLTILDINRTMASSPNPILPFTMYPLEQGHPIRFLIGPTQMPFDVHAGVLALNSPVFNKPFPSPITLPSMTPEDFGSITKWIYDRVPPTFTTAPDLKRICELWIAAAHLGIHLKANTLMRLGMELMQPPSFPCPLSIARWVFAYTPPSSPLRAYIVAIHAQRSQPEFHGSQPGDVEILTLSTAFMRKVEHARKVLALAGEGVAWAQDKKGLSVFPAEKEGEWRGAGKLPMPRYLVWDEMGVDVPDCFFVKPGTVAFEEGVAAVLKGE